MPVPWVQIFRLMPSILEVSRELLKRTRRLPTPDAEAARGEGAAAGSLESRISALEQNERSQAELITSMADQLSQLTTATSALHKLARWLMAGQVVTAVIAIAAVIIALR
jgi:uncharacterized coiled-coil protein SlyX